jgi:hypothetical protein
MEAKELVCRDCGMPFTWTASEQAFYANLGYVPPRRCPTCRKYLKRRIREVEERRAGEVQNGHQ